MIYPVRRERFTFSDFFINENELARRLSVPEGYRSDAIEKAINEVSSAVLCRAVCTRAAIEINGSVISFGDIKVTSSALAKNLCGCGEALIFAVTLGNGVDRLLRQKSVLSASEHFICDAVASAVADAAADKCNDIFTNGLRCKPRFSPGYGDLPLSFQRDIIRITDAEKTAGITLSEADLMIPQKSITAIIGILK